jgi:NADPH:quinone reductase-like Zn-dependent oxidoreductase
VAVSTQLEPGAFTIPATMVAVALDHYGPPGNLTVHRVAVPRPGPGEVLIALHTVGVGPWDLRQRQGEWIPGRQRFPLILGTDGSGVVVARGPGVRGLRLGKVVYASSYVNPRGGFYAEAVVVPASRVGRIPSTLDMEQAGAGITSGLTALQGLEQALGSRRGQDLLILGAAGAVGGLAVQLARWLGARVVAVARGLPAVRRLRRLGAEAVIDPGNPRAMSRLARLCPEGVDAALALACDDAIEALLDQVRPGGRIAFPRGVEPEPRRRRGVKLIRYDGEATPANLARLARAVRGSRLRVPIAARLPLVEAARAHRLLAAGHLNGKVVLEIHPSSRRRRREER